MTSLFPTRQAFLDTFFEEFWDLIHEQLHGLDDDVISEELCTEISIAKLQARIVHWEKTEKEPDEVEYPEMFTNIILRLEEEHRKGTICNLGGLRRITLKDHEQIQHDLKEWLDERAQRHAAEAFESKVKL